MDERTAEILKRFGNSWTETERYFSDLIENHVEFERLKPIRAFIETLRQRGDDKYFRLGTSMHYLIISRSVDFGLRRDQKFIRIEAYDASFVVTMRDGDKRYREYTVDSLEDTRVMKLLETLKDTLVD